MTPLPPKQGLKPLSEVPLTRQEMARYDTTSTKTRIETREKPEAERSVHPVMTPLPPKQGLKHAGIRRRVFLATVMTPLPPKQGLKRWMPYYLRLPSTVMTPLPPKQGLKRVG